METLEWLILLLIFGTLMCVTWGLGGWMLLGRPLVWSTWLICAAVVLFGLWWRFKSGPKRLVPAGLLLLPWVAYCAVSWLWVTSVPWLGRLEVALWAQAAALLFIIVHLFGSRRRRMVIVVASVLVVFFAVAVSFYQYYMNPGWLPLERTQSTVFSGRASGTFAVPNSFAGFMLLLLPLMLTMAAMKRFDAPVRVACGVLALLLFWGVVISVSRGAYIALLLVLLLSPLVLFERTRSRLKYLGYGLALLVSVGGSLWMLNPVLKTRIEQGWAYKGEITRPALWDAATAMFLDNPVVGQGASSYGFLWERFRPGDGMAHSNYAHNDYLEVLAEYGAIGFLLLFLPLFWCVWRGFREWFSTPFQKLSAEAAFRQLHHNIHGLEKDGKVAVEPRSSRRRRRSGAGGAKAAVPTSKIMLGGLLLGQLAFFIHLSVEFHFAFSALVFLLVMSLGLTLVYAEVPHRVLEGRYSGVAGLALSFLAAGAIFSVSLPAAHTAALYRAGSDRLDAVSETQTGVGRALNELEEAATDLSLAVGLMPEHADAWAALGRARIEQLRLAPYLDPALYEEAIRSTRTAVELRDEHWGYWVEYARALQLDAAPVAEVEAAYRNAVQYAPHNPVSWYYLAEFLSADPARLDEALQAAERSLELFPQFAPALDVRRRISLLRR